MSKSETSIPAGDQFLLGAEKLGQKLKPHVIKLVIVAVLAAFALIGWTIYDWYSERQERQATERFAGARDLSLGFVVPEGEEPPTLVAADMQPPPSFADKSARAKAVVAELSGLHGDHGSSGVSAHARLLEGKMLLEQKDYDRAIEVLETFVEADSSPELATTARENIGYALEAKALGSDDAQVRQKSLEAALEAFKSMQPDEKGFHHDFALYHQGRLLASLGRVDEAVTTYEKVLVDHPDSDLKVTIENRLNLLGKSE